MALAGALSGEGSDPELLLVFFNASSNSESAVAVESDSSSLSSTVKTGGGGDPALPLASAADSLLPPFSGWVKLASGESGGVWILTRFFFVRFAVRVGQSTTYLRTKPTDVCLQGASPTTSSAAVGVVGASCSGSLERRKGLDDMAANGRDQL